MPSIVLTQQISEYYRPTRHNHWELFESIENEFDARKTPTVQKSIWLNGD